MTTTNPRRKDTPPLTLHAALLRAFHVATVTDEPYRRLTEDSQKAADIAARIAEAFIEEARTLERARCAALLRGLAAGARRNGETVAATAMARLASEIDPLGPVMGAPAAGGTA
jgi:hypothetical protein